MRVQSGRAAPGRACSDLVGRPPILAPCAPHACTQVCRVLLGARSRAPGSGPPAVPASVQAFMDEALKGDRRELFVPPRCCANDKNCCI